MEQVDGLRAILRRLMDAAEAYAADQQYAIDERIGLVQPITVAEGKELNEALDQAREVLGENIETEEQKITREQVIREQLAYLKELTQSLREEGK